MEITVEEQSPVKKILHIEIPEDQVAKALDAAYNELKKTAKVKGFRPGKTPRSTLERMFRKNVHADVTSKLIQDSLIEAVQQKELPLVGQPNVDPPELDPKGPYKYDAVIEVRPELDEIDFKGLNLKKTLHKASDEEVDAQLEMLRKTLGFSKLMNKRLSITLGNMRRYLRFHFKRRCRVNRDLYREAMEGQIKHLKTTVLRSPENYRRWLRRVKQA